MHRLLIERPLVAFRNAAVIGCIIALATLSWLPASVMTRTTLGGHAEHLIAYLGTTMVLGMAVQTSSRLAVQCLLLIGYAAVLEAGQAFMAGRHASLHDFTFSSMGVVLGGLLLWAARSLIPGPLKFD